MSNVRSTCYILSYKSKRKYYGYKLLLALSTKRSLDLTKENLQPHNKATFFKICKYVISFSQYLIII